MNNSQFAQGASRLQESSRAAWRKLGAPRAPDFDSVVDRYEEPHRAYHTLEHILECHGWLEVARDLAERPLEVELALLYHDIVYDPLRTDNERQSAVLFGAHAASAGLAVEPARRISALIEGTASHSSCSGDAALVNDIDLAVLGASPRRYDLFEEQVRTEYAQIEFQDYRAGRARVLRAFLEKTTIYSTQMFERRLEAQARWNLPHALADLEDGGASSPSS